MPSIPNVLDSSGTIGTTLLPITLSLTIIFNIRTKAIVVEISRPSTVASNNGANVSMVGTSKDSAFALLWGR